MTNDLLSIALVGTARGAAPDLPLPAALNEAAIHLPKAPPAHSLLDRASLWFAYESCGRTPAAATIQLPACEPDALPQCSARAADILQDLLGDKSRELIAEWLQLATLAKKRAPHRLLPALLDHAARQRDVRDLLPAVIDRRGAWLMSLNPDWQITVPTGEDDDSVWQTGSHEQRVSLLRRIRVTDPGRARQWIEATWQDEPADHRAQFLSAMLAGLSMDDEPFLESALDDRSKQVRQAAADLLARLPESKLVARMIERLTPLLVFHPATSGSALKLKRGAAARLDVVLPSVCDKAMQRDGIDEKITGKGQKQYWLEQMLGMVAPSHWTKTWKLPPQECVALAGGDYANALVEGWSQACERHPDPEWIEPLLRRGFAHAGEARLNRTLLTALPPARFLAFAIDVLNAKQTTLTTCSDLINGGSAPLDLAVGRLFIETVADLANGGARQDVSILWTMIEQCAMRLPPTLHDEIAKRWNVEREPWSSYKRQVDSLLGTLDLRRQMRKEFT